MGKLKPSRRSSTPWEYAMQDLAPALEVYPVHHLPIIKAYAVSDCVETYQNGQDENGAFFWHQICRGSRL